MQAHGVGTGLSVIPGMFCNEDATRNSLNSQLASFADWMISDQVDG
jgi:hypothetical protein